MSIASDNLYADRATPRIAPRKIPRRTSAAAVVTKPGQSLRTRLVRLALVNRVWLLAFGHGMVFALAYWFAFMLRFDFVVPANHVSRFWVTLPAILAIKLYIFYITGHFHGWWRYVTFSDLAALLRASAASLLALVILNHYVLEGFVPRAVVVMDCFVSALVLGAMRSSWRFFREQLWLRAGHQRVALMVGAHHANGILAHQIHSHDELSYRIVGFLDNDPQRHGQRLGGIPVLGEIASASVIAAGCKATDLLVLADQLQGAQLRKLMDQCDQANLRLKVVPSVADQWNGNIPVRDVEINDLLGREPVELDNESISQEVAGKVILITGAGGSIGSEICRQLLQFQPQQMILVDNGENALFLITNELTRVTETTRLKPCVADVLDGDRMRQIFAEHRPDLVIHAAAHKHVGLMEGNVAQCVRNNVFGSKSVADLAHQYGAAKFVLISTDKAVNPSSVMGASKQIAERYIHAMAQESPTAFVVVRFGNVLGSNGSVVPIFKEQILRGGPVTVTDERMTRFFMTIPEAAQLVLQAAAMGKGGEIFVLEMGEQVRIADLARDLIRLSGLPSDAIEIQYIGMRPGEKLYEELYFDEERSLQTSHPKLRAACHRPYSIDEVLAAIDSLGRLLDAPDARVRQRLKEIVPEYTSPIEFADPSTGTLSVLHTGGGLADHSMPGDPASA